MKEEPKDYSLDYLIETFREHTIKSEEDRKKSREQFIKDYPDDEVPEHFNEEFNIANALYCICTEIKRLNYSK